MIKNFNTRDTEEYPLLLDFILNNVDYDFYYTESNTRIYITDEKSLKKLFQASDCIFTLKENGDYIGIILLWKSLGGEKNRYYIKVNAINTNVARNLLTSLTWNFKDDMFAKIRKDSKFLSIFRSKGFKFLGGRGIQVLLKRKYKKEERK